MESTGSRLTIHRILGLAAESRPESQKLTVRRGGHSVRLEIFSQGGREDGRSGRREFLGDSRCRRANWRTRRARQPPAYSKEIFLVLVLQKQKCVLSQDLPSSRPPCK